MNPPADSLSGKVILITGAGSGLGEAMAKMLAACGAKVGLLDRDEPAVRRVADEINAVGGEARAVAVDVISFDQLEAGVAAIHEIWGRIDTVVANAGTNGTWAPIDDLTPEEWDRTLDVNLKGVFLTVRACTPRLKENRGGSIILIASIIGTRLFSTSGATAYASSKAAVVAFGRMVALELAKDKIRVNTICPGAFTTNIMVNMEARNLHGLHLPVDFPKGRVPLNDGKTGKPEQVAHLVWFLASDFSDHITGTEVYIDGGHSLLVG